MEIPKQLMWLKKTKQYFFLFFTILVIASGIFYSFNLFYTPVDNSLYFLSSIVTCQAAIISIIITLTLVAVQLTATSYTPRIVDLFKKNLDIKILLIVYIFALTLGFTLLKIIQGDSSNVGSYEFYIFLVYVFGIFTFFALFPYTFNIIEFLRPERIIENLTNEIFEDNRINTENEPFQSIFDLIHNSILKHDLHVTRIALLTLNKKMIEKFKSVTKEEDINEKYCLHLVRSANIALNIKDEEQVLVITQILKDFCIFLINEEREALSTNIIDAFQEIGVSAAENRQLRVVAHIGSDIENLGTISIEKNLTEIPRYCFMALHNILLDIVRYNLPTQDNVYCEHIMFLTENIIEKKRKELYYIALFNIIDAWLIRSGKWDQFTINLAISNVKKIIEIDEKIFSKVYEDYFEGGYYDSNEIQLLMDFKRILEMK